MRRLTLRTTVEPAGPAAAILLTEEQVAALSDVRNPPVTVTVGGTTVRLRVARMGGVSMIGLSRAARSELGVEVGQEVEVVVALDTAERTVDLPPELAASLEADPEARAAFDRLSYTARKEAARSVAEARRPETRERRLQALLRRLT